MTSTLRGTKAYDRYLEGYSKRDGYLKWKFSKPNRWKLVGRNRYGKNVMRMELFIGDSVGRRKQIRRCFLKGWSGEYGPKLRDWGIRNEY